MDIIIVSDLSGSGKSVALHSLKDLGHCCTDNLPAALLPQFLNQFKPMANTYAEHAAITTQPTSSIAWLPHSGIGANFYSSVNGIYDDYPEALVD